MARQLSLLAALNIAFLALNTLLTVVSHLHIRSNGDRADASPRALLRRWSASSPSPCDDNTLTGNRLAIIVPMIAGDIPRLRRALEQWSRVQPACDLYGPERFGLFFLNNLDEDAYRDHLRLEDVIAATPSLAAAIHPCVGEVRTIFAQLTPEQDAYPEGPSWMFFKMFQEDRLRLGELGNYSHVLWQEWDARPVRPGWLDRMLVATGGERFWIKGSHYVSGPAFDATIMYEANWQWVGHINGNALYTLHDAEFHKFQRLTMQWEPPSHFWKPFDIAMWKVLHTFPYSWRMYQQFVPYFQHTRLIRHMGFTAPANPDEESALIAAHPDIVLIHGEPGSAGTHKFHAKFKDGVPQTNKTVYWNDEVEPSARLSVMVRTNAAHLPYAVHALASAKRHVPWALEYVAVVPEEDAPAAREALPPWVRVVPEARVLQDDSLQAKFSVLHADQHCAGRFIMHLDSDELLTRMVQNKDIFMFGKPIVMMDSYDNLRAQWNGVKGRRVPAGLWQNGTEAAIGRPVPLEFTQARVPVMPRELYDEARRFIERHHATPLVDFLASKLARFTDGVYLPGGGINQELLGIESGRLFHTLNFLSAFSYNWWHPLFTWTWVGEGSAPPGTKAEAAPYSLLRPQMTCQGDALAVEALPGLQARQLEIFGIVARGEAHCGHLEAFAASVQSGATR